MLLFVELVLSGVLLESVSGFLLGSEEVAPEVLAENVTVSVDPLYFPSISSVIAAIVIFLPLMSLGKVKLPSKNIFSPPFI